MSHSQRQKKRSAQFRKKHFDAKSRDHGERSKKEHQTQTVDAPGEKNLPQQQPAGGREGLAREKELGEHSQPLKQENKAKTYSRRKVTSNWERYGDDDAVEVTYTPETEEQLEMRLVQLLKLPQVPEDISWTPSGDSGGEEGPSRHLSLNIAELAESLQTLPIQARLALPCELMQHYGVSEKDLVLDDDSGRNEASTPSSSHHQPSTTFDPKSFLSRDTDHFFNFSTPNKNKVRAPSSSLQTDRTHTTSDSNRGLESLLLTSDKTPAPLHTHRHPSAHKTHLHTDTLPISQPLAGTEPQHRSGVGQALPSTAELDDMLDDLLT